MGGAKVGTRDADNTEVTKPAWVICSRSCGRDMLPECLQQAKNVHQTDTARSHADQTRKIVL